MRAIAATALGLSILAAPAGVDGAGGAERAVATAPEITRGTVTAINDEESSFTITTSDDEEITVTFDDKTVWVLGNEVSTREAVLKEDRDVSVTHADGVATRVKTKKSS